MYPQGDLTVDHSTAQSSKALGGINALKPRRFLL